MARIEVEDFVVVSEQGVQTVGKQLPGIQKQVAQKNWFPSGAKNVTDELRVRFYQNSAVITGLLANDTTGGGFVVFLSPDDEVLSPAS